jgi:uncharacterized protein YrzB (UPF0473 family)
MEKAMNDNEILFTDEDGEEVYMSVITQTQCNGFNYLLVTEAEDEVLSKEDEADAYIMKELPGGDTETSTYQIVEDEDELSAVSQIFKELLDDIEIQYPEEEDI